MPCMTQGLASRQCIHNAEPNLCSGADVRLSTFQHTGCACRDLWHNFVPRHMSDLTCVIHTKLFRSSRRASAQRWACGRPPNACRGLVSIPAVHPNETTVGVRTCGWHLFVITQLHKLFYIRGTGPLRPGVQSTIGLFIAGCKNVCSHHLGGLDDLPR